MITGFTGQLGQSFKSVLENNSQYNVLWVGREQLDFDTPDSIFLYIEQNPVDVIINCAAFTEVDNAESHFDLAYKINCLAVEQLALVAFKNKIKLIHISTDYVFNGENFKPYIEDNETNPVNKYGQTKLEGEQALLKQLPENGLIIRTSWVYSEFGNNFLKTIKKIASERNNLNIVADQVGSPTYAKDLALAVINIIETPRFQTINFPTELFHYSNEGICSWYDFAKNIVELFNIECTLSPIETTQYPTPAKRPYYSVLNKMKIKKYFDLSIPHWQQSLKQCANSMMDDEL